MNKRSFPDDWPKGKPARRSNGLDSDGKSVETQLTDSEIIELAWCDQTTFDSIEEQSGLTEQNVIHLMRSRLKPSSFKLWRKRVSGRPAKHGAKSPQRLKKIS